jgi:hypothetical protein
MGLVVFMLVALAATRALTPQDIAPALLVGGLVSAFFAGGRWLADSLYGSPLVRVLGAAAGLSVGILALAPIMNPEDLPHLTWAAAGALLTGTAVALGWESSGIRNRPSSVKRAALGGGLGGATICAIIGWSATEGEGLLLPFLLKPDFFRVHLPALPPAPIMIISGALAGALLGGGMAGGGAAGLAIWNRLRQAK